MLNLTREAELLCSFANGTRWQVEVDLVNDLAQMALHVRDDDSFGQALAISLVSTVVLDLYMKIERSFTTVNLLAVLVRANVLAVDLFCSASVVLFARCRLAAVSAVRLPH